MSENTVHDITDLPQTESRFNKLKIAKAAAITTAVVVVAVVLKNKLNSSVDGEVNVTVETADKA